MLSRPVVTACLVALFSISGVGAGVAETRPIDLSSLKAGDTVAVGELRGGVCYFEEQTAEVVLSEERPFAYDRMRITDDCRLVLTFLCTAPQDCPVEFAKATAGLQPPEAIPLSHCTQTSGHARQDFWTEGQGAHFIDPPGVQNGVKEDLLTEVYNEIYYYWSCSDGQPYVWNAFGDCLMNGGNGWHLETPCENPRPCPYASGSYCRSVRGDFGCHNLNFCATDHYHHQLQGQIRIWNDNFLVCSRTWSGAMPPHGDDTHIDGYCAYL